MPNRRLARLNEQLKREISGLLRTSVRDPRIGTVTVTGVRVAADLDVARVFVRPQVAGPRKDEALQGLEAAAPYLRRSLGQMLRIRRVPELRFVLDSTLDEARRIEEILEEVRPDGGWPEPDAEDEPSGSEEGEGTAS